MKDMVTVQESSEKAGIPFTCVRVDLYGGSTAERVISAKENVSFRCAQRR